MIAERQSVLPSRHSILALIACSLLLFLGSASSLFACTCGKATTCERFNSYETIFIGKAIHVEREEKDSFKTETTVFEIKQIFSGDNAQTIRVKNKSGFSCDVNFAVGETYLIFAGGDKQKGFGTGFCSGNLPLKFASEEISELQKLSGATGDGLLRGTVLEESKKRGADRTPLRDVRLEITELSTGRKYNTKTDTGGRYEIAVPPGKYAVKSVAPSNSVHTSLFEVEPMAVRSGGCGEGFFVLVNDSIIKGRLFDAEGKPAPHVRVDLISVEEENSYLGGMNGESDPNGYFSIDQVPAGKYTLSVNFSSNPDPERPFPTTFYPAGGDRMHAGILEVGFGTKIHGITWHLPERLIEKPISGNVIWDDGSPAVGAEIRLFDMAFPGFYAGCYMLKKRDQPEDVNSPVRSMSIHSVGSACGLKSDSNGSFRLSGYTGRTYRLSASITKTSDGEKIAYTADSEPLSLSGEQPTIKLILKSK